MLEELDFEQTPLGELVLRRRRSPAAGGDWIYEVKLADEMLMSSLVNHAERELSRVALADRAGPLDVLVGGLGLGYTAAAALDLPQVKRVDVVELLEPVIRWHRARLVPMADGLMADPRCTLIQGDFFQLATGPATAGPLPLARYDAILVDIDHSPEHLLHPRHGGFYGVDGLKRLRDRLNEGGVFGLWSADAPTESFHADLSAVFDRVGVHEVRFHNPHIRASDSNWIILAGC